MSSSGSSQPCQLVQAYLQSYYICLVLNSLYDKSVAAVTFTHSRDVMLHSPLVFKEISDNETWSR